MNLESEISEKEKNNYYILMYICEIWKKIGIDALIYKAEIEMQI